MELGVTMVATLKNPDLGDFMLGDDDDEVVLEALDQEVAQRLFVALQFFRGEWFLDEEEGAPFFERILVKNPGDRVIRSIFSQIIENTEGVEKLTYFTYSIDRERRMSVVFKCLLVDGTLFKSTEYARFVVADV